MADATSSNFGDSSPKEYKEQNITEVKMNGIPVDPRTGTFTVKTLEKPETFNPYNRLTGTKGAFPPVGGELHPKSNDQEFLRLKEELENKEKEKELIAERAKRQGKLEGYIGQLETLAALSDSNKLGILEVENKIAELRKLEVSLADIADFSAIDQEITSLQNYISKARKTVHSKLEEKNLEAGRLARQDRIQGFIEELQTLFEQCDNNQLECQELTEKLEELYTQKDSLSLLKDFTEIDKELTDLPAHIAAYREAIHTALLNAAEKNISNKSFIEIAEEFKKLFEEFNDLGSYKDSDLTNKITSLNFLLVGDSDEDRQEAFENNKDKDFDTIKSQLKELQTAIQKTKERKITEETIQASEAQNREKIERALSSKEYHRLIYRPKITKRSTWSSLMERSKKRVPGITMDITGESPWLKLSGLPIETIAPEREDFKAILPKNVKLEAGEEAPQSDGLVRSIKTPEVKREGAKENAVANLMSTISSKFAKKWRTWSVASAETSSSRTPTTIENILENKSWKDLLGNLTERERADILEMANDLAKPSSELSYEAFHQKYAPVLELLSGKNIDLSKKQALDAINTSELLNGASTGIYTDHEIRAALSKIVATLQKIQQIIEDDLSGKHVYQKRPYVYTAETLRYKDFFDTVRNLVARTK